MGAIVRRLMSRHVWISSLVVVLFGGVVGWLVTRPNDRELTFGDVVILGRLNWFGSNGEYFSLRVTGLEAAPVFIVVSGRRLTLNTVTPAELQESGFQESSDRRGGRRFLSVGYGEQNRDGSVDFLFQETAMKEVYFRCHRTDACGFSIGWEGGQSFSLPIDESDLRSHLPQTPKVRFFRTLVQRRQRGRRSQPARSLLGPDRVRCRRDFLLLTRTGHRATGHVRHVLTQVS